MDEQSPPVRILTNTSWLDGHEVAGRPVTPVRLPETSSLRQMLRYLALWRYDGAFLNIESRWLLLLCMAKKLLPFSRFRILSIDLILNRPRGLKGYLRFYLRRWLLGEVDRFVLYYRDTAEVERIYAIPQDRVRYVPFKVNTLEQLQEMPVEDEGFFLACGRSNRDYRTLCAALSRLPYACKILAPWGAEREHGTRFDGVEVPPNVELVSDDGSAESWNRWISRARAVVLPIAPGRLSPSGISTYLVAMALGKCVIITESPATSRILDDTMAVLVPPSDEEAMYRALARVAEDAEYREWVASVGKRYALSLGGEERLTRDLREELADLFTPEPARVADAVRTRESAPEG